MAVIVIGFNDFKKLADGHRVYYYEKSDAVDFHYLVDGTVVKSSIGKTELGNPQRFFSDKVFYGAIALEFNIPITADNKTTMVLEPKKDTPPITLIQDEEIKQTDIQAEGVE